MVGSKISEPRLVIGGKFVLVPENNCLRQKRGEQISHR